MVREKRTGLERQLSHLSNEIQNLLQVHVSEYQQGNDAVLYLNSQNVNYDPGEEGQASIMDKNLADLGVEVLTPEDIQERRARNNGVAVEGLLEAPPSYAPLSHETVTLNVYPENIANPEESVAKTPDFVQDHVDSGSDPGHFIDDGTDSDYWRT